MQDDLTTDGCAPASLTTYATWTTAAKDAVGCSLGSSRLWFTCAQGIITEVYYPRIDIPQLRDLGFIVGDRHGFWVEIRRLNDYTVQWEEGVIPAITMTHRHPRFTLTLQVCSDPKRDVLVVHFALAGDQALQVYLLAAPRLGEDAHHNKAYVGEWEGHPVLWAEQGPFGLAIVACDDQRRIAFARRSVGVASESDLWQDLTRNGAMTKFYTEAGPGNVALAAELSGASGAIAVGFGASKETAATLALGALMGGFTPLWSHYCALWRDWHAGLPPMPKESLEPHAEALLKLSATIMKVHMDKTVPGALVASLSIPWGASSESRAGYHLVWSRDLVETAAALVALGAMTEAREILLYLMATQQKDGHWLQNQWLGGKPYWQGMQLDETGFPVLLAALLNDHKALTDIPVTDMVRQALAFIVRTGPATGQDRWEEDGGINTFTLAIVIAALVEGAQFLTGRERDCALLVADYWNSRLEEWTFVQATATATRLGLSGYYVRVAPADVLTRSDANSEPLVIKNRNDLMAPQASEQVGTDFLQLCRFGLRSPDDPQILSSVQTVDALLKTETPNGPVWHRYNGDGYGEHPDGAPFNGWGQGRGWPLLVGERGHYELLAGRDTRPYVAAMAAMVGTGGMLPEQVWDSAPIPERGLHPGQPSGSAMPLVWAHSEFIKLVLSISQGAPIDRPKAAWRRYAGKRPHPTFQIWRFQHPITSLEPEQDLYFFIEADGVLHFGHDGWRDPQDISSEDWGLAHVIALKAETLHGHKRLDFTFFWPGAHRWEGKDFHIDRKIVKETA
ncbi:MAG TPA: glycoside hydrolase family 15 protein [Acidiferrobacter sp.]|nr:glycoside hydrolase family 15 protein [Acidiferrobacter sp.]